MRAAQVAPWASSSLRRRARSQASLDQTQSVVISKPYQGIVTALEAFQMRARWF
jgi:hypothetical protein